MVISYQINIDKNYIVISSFYTEESTRNIRINSVYDLTTNLIYIFNEEGEIRKTSSIFKERVQDDKYQILEQIITNEKVSILGRPCNKTTTKYKPINFYNFEKGYNLVIDKYTFDGRIVSKYLKEEYIPFLPFIGSTYKENREIVFKCDEYDDSGDGESQKVELYSIDNIVEIQGFSELEETAILKTIEHLE